MEVLAPFDRIFLTRATWSVQFLGSPAVGDGVTNQFILMFLHHNVRSLFDFTDDRQLYLSPKDNGDPATWPLYNTFGRILGLAFIRRITPGISFSWATISSLYAPVTGMTSTARDVLQNDDPQVLQSILNTAKYVETGEATELEFDDPDTKETIQVTRDTVDRFISVETVRHAFQHDGTPSQINFLTGFFDIVPIGMTNALTIQELYTAFAGNPDIDIQALRAVSNVYPGQEEFPQVQMFWEVVSGFDVQMKMKFLYFVSAQNLTPIGGFKPGFMRVMFTDDNTDRLPTARTCFKIIEMPKYENVEKMSRKLGQAIELANELTNH